MNIDLRQLEVLQAVAAHGSLTEAAGVLHVTQPAISHQIRKLETELGVALTERAGRRIRLTAAGQEVVQHAARIAQAIDDLRENMRQHSGLVRGQLRIAAVSTANYFITDDIGRFRQRFPAIEIGLQVANRDGILALLDANQSDLAITGQLPEDSDLIARPFKPNPLVVIARPDHPLTGSNVIAPQELVMHPFVFREPGSGTQAAMERAFLEHGLECRPSCVMPTAEAVKQAVQADLGIAVISRQTIQLELETGRLAILPCNALSLTRQWFLVYRSFRRLPPAALEFRNQLLASA